MVKTQRFHCQGLSSIPGRGTKILQVVCPKKIFKKGVGSGSELQVSLGELLCSSVPQFSHLANGMPGISSKGSKVLAFIIICFYY